MDTELKIKDYPILGWLFGFGGLIAGAFLIVTTIGPARTNGFFLAGLGILFTLFNYGLTITADKQTGLLTLRYRSIFLSSVKEIPLNQIRSIRVDSSTSRGRRRGTRTTNYRVEAILKSGEHIPFRSYYTGGALKHQKMADDLRIFLGLPEEMDETPIGIVRGIPSLGKAAAQVQQEAMTGANEEARVTDGVSWQIQSISMGAMPATRWYSSAFKTQTGFLFLAQITPGQSSTGILATLSKVLFKQSISLYGFTNSDTPNLEKAELYSNLPQALATHFMAFISDPHETRQIINPWVQTPLTQWAEKYPLKQIQSNARFNQIVVLFNHNGVYLATQGVLPPDKLEELTNLGIELVKAQGV